MTQAAPPELTRRQEWIVRAVLLAGSMVFVALAAEVSLRLVAPPAEPTRGDAVRDPFHFFDHHPFLGWDLVPGAVDRHKKAEFDVAIRISEQGLRSDRLYDETPAPGVRRAVVLGDSFTFGHGVEVEEGWVARVEAGHGAGPDQAGGAPETEMVNLAVTGYGVDQMVLRLEERSEGRLAFSPQLVVAAIFLADVFRTAEDAHIGYHKPRFVVDPASPDGLRLTGVPVPVEAAAHADRSSGSQLLRLVRERGVPLVRHLGWGDAWPVTARLLDRLQRGVEDGGAQLAVVLVPKDVAVLGDGVRHELNLGAMARLQALLDERHIPTLDLTDTLAKEARTSDRALYFPVDGHWTAAGHAVAARAVSRWLEGLWQERQTSDESGDAG